MENKIHVPNHQPVSVLKKKHVVFSWMEVGVGPKMLGFCEMNHFSRAYS